MRASLFQELLPAVSLQQVCHLLDCWHFSFASVAPMLGLRGLFALVIPWRSNHVLGGWCQARHHVCYCLSYKLVIGTCLVLPSCYGFSAVLAPKACYGLQAAMASLFLLLLTQILVCVCM